MFICFPVIIHVFCIVFLPSFLGCFGPGRRIDLFINHVVCLKGRKEEGRRHEVAACFYMVVFARVLAGWLDLVFVSSWSLTRSVLGMVLGRCDCFFLLALFFY